jgi:hypothetical protein
VKAVLKRLQLLGLVLLLAALACAWTDANMVVNGDMAMDWDKNGLPDYWSITWLFSGGPNKPSMDHNENIDGNASLRLDVTSLDVANNFAGRVYQDIPVTSGKTYEISMWVKANWKTADGQSPAGINISYWLQGTNKQWGNREDLTDLVDGTFNWREIKATITIPPKTQAIRLALFAYKGTGTIWIDSIKMVEVK